ncbi:hypothetical protein CDL15_Pgr028677 [Punica granatum]|uniref:Uncharacterized protein n=1 Tax=Punica granatum TaxID=22663 RepID=A0A218VXG0_PUNGR|nr:hypothetical protein CDL15_Pgr028677 [Punica granatum]PKI67088.1 hypothetical protein CRG98_012509 [Punica granatum]
MEEDPDRVKTQVSLLEANIRAHLEQHNSKFKGEVLSKVQELLAQLESKMDKKLGKELKKHDKGILKRFKSMEDKMNDGFAAIMGQLVKKKKRKKGDDFFEHILADYSQTHGRRGIRGR